MDEGQTENYNDWPDQNKKLKIEYEPSDNVSVLHSIENIDMLYEEIEIKNEPIDKGFILSSIENTKMEISSYIPIIKQEASETNTNSKRLKESDTDIKSEIIFDICAKNQNNISIETENLPTIEKDEDFVEYQLPYGWKKVGHQRKDKGGLISKDFSNLRRLGNQMIVHQHGRLNFPAIKSSKTITLYS